MPTISDSGGFLRKLEQGFVDARISPNHAIVCAVSGGPDSTALVLAAHLARHLYADLVVAHFNHRARGEESDADEEFVRRLCRDKGITLHVGKAPRATEYVDENSARRERYGFLAETADATNADAIVVAHTLEDQAETVLLRLTRGAGIRGAGGMRPSRSIATPSGRKVNVARPMLGISRTEAVGFLDSSDVTARHDSSNDDWSKYARNRIRHRVMPELREMNPNADSAISRFAEILRSNIDFVEELAVEAMRSASTGQPHTLARTRVAHLHPVVQAELLRRVYRSVAGPDSQLDQGQLFILSALIGGGKSSSYDLPGGVSFQSDHENVSFYRRDANRPDLAPYPGPISDAMLLSIPGSVDIGDGYRIEAAMSQITRELGNDPPNEAWLAPELSEAGCLEIRNRQSSDRFNPLGMSQDVGLNDFLINSKIPAPWRDRIPLVVSPADGRIAWLAGIRPSEWAKLQPKHESALHLRMSSDSSQTETVDRSAP